MEIPRRLIPSGLFRARRWLVAGAALLAGCGGPAASVGQAVTVPPWPPGCLATSGHASQSRTLPVHVVRYATGRTLVLAGVCLSGQGPFDFVVDTGASTTVIDRSVADRVDLGDRSAPFTITAIGSCRRSVVVAHTARWSVGGVDLAPQPVIVGPLRIPYLPTVVGLLGSDVLSSFGSVRFDFSAQTLTLASGRQHPLSASVAPGTGQIPMGVQVQSERHGLTLVRPSVPVTINGSPADFTLDTGAATTVVAPALTRSLAGLKGREGGEAGLSCPVTNTYYRVSAWRVGSVPLAPATVASTDIGPIPGLLGSGTLEHYSPVVVDYRDGYLRLGS
jgi:predicted aspartyl protease